MAEKSPAAVLKHISEHNMEMIEFIGAVDSLKKRHALNSISDLYKAWIARNQEHPFLYAILFNHGTILTDVGDLEGARDCFEKSIAVNPDFAPSRINLGRIYERTGKVPDAVTQWTEAINRLGSVNGTNLVHKTTALNQLARLLEFNHQDEAARDAMEKSLDADSHQHEVIQHLIAAKQRLFEFPIIVPVGRATKKILLSGISPLSTAVYTDDPMFQLACNWNYNMKDIGEPIAEIYTSHIAACEGREGAPLRIGYLSSDLREHAIGFLTAEMFGLHDRKAVEVFVYYCGIPAEDSTKKRIRDSVDHWVSLQDMDDVTAARRIADDGIQILVDVNGYTRDARVKMLALRPAPIIVNWLGFPGSMASPYHHYIVSDEWIIPKENEKYYSEKVMRLPCYQPNDRNRVISSDVPTRAQAKLPEKAMVYCSFNGVQKISRHTFDRWLKILGRVPDSVLWLLAGHEKMNNSLRAYAEEHGIKGDRIIFAEKMPNPKHLARYRLADLFIDTAPYGAHTTASDALWMGVPVLTMSGRAFASRVCGSLIRAAGLPELVCKTPDEFVDRAVALGKDKSALLKYRERLAASRDTCDLFNTTKLVQHLEGLYKQMWQEFKEGKLPQPDLHNLDVYLEVGMKHDHDREEVQAIKDYEGMWLKNLSERHKYRPIKTDNRMWTEAAQAKIKA